MVEFRSHLLIISEREALAWVLRERRMAFPAGRRHAVSILQRGDTLFLYTTRSCFHNPTIHRGRIAGLARALTAPRALDAPVTLAGRTFGLGCRLEFLALSPLHQGLELAPLVNRLAVFPAKHAWSAFLRRPLLTLPHEDAALILRHLAPLVGPAEAALPGYLAAAQLSAAGPLTTAAPRSGLQGARPPSP